MRNAGQGRLSPGVALFLLASILVSFLAASAAPTPLYGIYQERWHFSPITTTVVFAVYALAVLASLLTFGKLSDHVGRRPVLLVTIAIQMIALVIFVFAGGVPTLVAARVVQGLAAGAATGAVGAAMLDINPARGTLANSIAPGVGTGTGALLSALLIQFFPAPTRLVYVVLFVVLLIQGIGVVLMGETVTPMRGALQSLRPEIRLPRAVRAPVLVVAPVVFSVWALAGFFGALGPALTRALMESSIVAGGLVVFVFAVFGTIAVLLLRNAPARTVMLTGISALILGMIITLVAVTTESVAGFFVGLAFGGVGFGAGFQGSLKTVVPLVEAHERASMLSVLYIVCYVGFGLPTVIAGFLVVHGGLLLTAKQYVVAVILLALVALLGLRKADRAPARR
ncbi:Predicted arabinose efflux permease, MFS family [Micromonospora purpureochromogenes]|uniref:Predicted arabinose efflux permease, MFS family n=1 Tax=Micromonospora purpureochromogenes TaxID=47872 RepID=A0A1C4ZPP7_9ACTN|nr:MFS transporter [Micromonospora purpureochromogenes]SCF34862.1 Predicted arabinose efflux permease, MFS family [Micromonospora purpureochromogenes]